MPGGVRRALAQRCTLDVHGRAAHVSTAQGQGNFCRILSILAVRSVLFTCSLSQKRQNMIKNGKILNVLILVFLHDYFILYINKTY